MNRMIYFAPLACFPLMALAQQSSGDSMKTDNPYVAALLILIVTLSVAVAITGYFRFEKRGRAVTGIIFGVLDWLITAPVCISAGVNSYVSLAIATASALLLAFMMVRYGRNLSSFFQRNDAKRIDADED